MSGSEFVTRETVKGRGGLRFLPFSGFCVAPNGMVSS